MFTPYFHKQFKKDIKSCKKDDKKMEEIKIKPPLDGGFIIKLKYSK